MGMLRVIEEIKEGMRVRQSGIDLVEGVHDDLGGRPPLPNRPVSSQLFNLFAGFHYSNGVICCAIRVIDGIASLD